MERSYRERYIGLLVGRYFFSSYVINKLVLPTTLHLKVVSYFRSTNIEAIVLASDRNLSMPISF